MYCICVPSYFWHINYYYKLKPFKIAIGDDLWINLKKMKMFYNVQLTFRLHCTLNEDLYAKFLFNQTQLLYCSFQSYQTPVVQNAF